MNLVTLIEANLFKIASILTSLLLLVPQVRRLIVELWRRFSLLLGGKKQDLILEKLEMLTVISATLATSSERLAVIEKEMKFNGGQSIKDMLYLMFAYRRHDYWRIGRPAMEMDGTGQVTLVSEAACKLFGVVNPDDLKRRSWLRFLAPGTVDDFLRAYAETVLYQSEFSTCIRIHTDAGVNRGEWDLRASPITQEHAVTKIYSGHLAPVDAVAMAVAADIHWAFQTRHPEPGSSKELVEVTHPVQDAVPFTR